MKKSKKLKTHVVDIAFTAFLMGVSVTLMTIRAFVNSHKEEKLNTEKS